MCRWGNTSLVTVLSGETVGVDSCISDLVYQLNKHGVKTQGSCCGHGKFEGEIPILQDGKEIWLKLFKQRPHLITTREIG